MTYSVNPAQWLVNNAPPETIFALYAKKENRKEIESWIEKATESRKAELRFFFKSQLLTRD